VDVGLPVVREATAASDLPVREMHSDLQTGLPMLIAQAKTERMAAAAIGVRSGVR
jgi:hypothetical protein